MQSANRIPTLGATARVWNDLTDRERREAMACYYASITEIDAQYGRLIRRLEERDALNNTIVVFNGFDFDELYNLDEDPYEMRNRANDSACAERLRELVAQLWRKIRETGDDALSNANHPILKLVPYGPEG